MAEDEPTDALDDDDSAGDVDPKKLPISEAADFKTIYANTSAIQGSIFDIAITFAEIIDGARVEKKCRIVMSPQLAKALMFGLVNQIKGWEQSFGMLPTLSSQVRETPAPSTNASSEPEPPPSQSPNAPSE